ncbi:MAG: MBOAT family O-acyltransferase [Gammaproteobacteria bacterium]
MLFNSYAFILAYLPVVFFGFYGLGRYGHRWASLWLAAASLFFYGWWDYRYVALLLASVTFNYGSGWAIANVRSLKPKITLALAVVANLLLLGYYKYANFFIENLNGLIGGELTGIEIILPLGISFFTFTQIAYLVDTFQGKVRETNFVHYILFVTYFPHLIAGPVLHHKEMMPQFAQYDHCRIDLKNIAVGLTIFILGLAKKVLIADSLAEYATPIFNGVSAGLHPLLFDAWIGALGFTFQLYFDFSGYSDMAIGLSLLFNVRLPVNFNSPYKAVSIIEFWRCWHMTLSRFLRDYLYIPLGGNRKGPGRRYLNLMITMSLGGLWHGAGWTFVIWGGLHGFYLTVNHLWIDWKRRMHWRDGGRWSRTASALLTFLLVVVGWVFFRADTLEAALEIIQGMLGMNGCSFSRKMEMTAFGQVMKGLGAQFTGTLNLTELNSGRAFVLLGLSMLVAFRFPNVQNHFQRYRPVLDDNFSDASAEMVQSPGHRYFTLVKWQATPLSAWAMGLLFVYTLLNFTKVTEFLYFRF